MLNSPREDGQQPISLVVSKHLLKVFPIAQVEAVLVGSADTEDGSAERFQRRSILKHQIHVIAEEAD